MYEKCINFCLNSIKKKSLNLKKELPAIYSVKLSVIKLNLLPGKILFYVENERTTSREKIGA